ncbi:MAG: nuclear transport factor 2 family protein, partial [Bacteroidota bacterium]
ILMDTINLKENALKGLHAFIRDHDAEKAQKYFKPDYIMHNPTAPQGLEHSLKMIPILQETGTTVKTHRIFQDGNIVFMHNTLHNAAPFGAEELVIFDVYRMEDGMVAEHWDALMPLGGTSYGNTQVDGVTEVTDHDMTARNKELTQALIQKVFIEGDEEAVPKYFSQKQYVQHNPLFPDGYDNFLQAMQMMKQMPDFQYVKAHHIWGEGNFVLAAGEGRSKEGGTIIYDLFRFEDEKVVEHWDVIQPIPEEKANDNGIF